jgi:predicted  nucleic acid-binding Zn-ribbon protein
MHPDLPKLLDVQGKDRRLAETGGVLAQLAAERAALDAALESARQQIASLERAVAEVATRREEREKKLENQRNLQERRRERLEQERNPRVAAQLMADIELARSILTSEETAWLQLADELSQREATLAAAQNALAELEASQAGARSELDSRGAAAQAEHDAAQAERDAAAKGLDRTLRTRYDRLRGSRKGEVLVPASNSTCTACYTAIPRSRIGQLQADGILLDGCEMCGAILYLEESAS